jgi:hypothetical protein
MSFSMPMIGFLYNRYGHTNEVVNYDGRETVGIASYGRQYSVVQIHIGEIFRISANVGISQQWRWQK